MLPIRFFVTFVLAILAVNHVAAVDRPNVVVMLMDDLGYFATRSTTPWRLAGCVEVTPDDVTAA